MKILKNMIILLLLIFGAFAAVFCFFFAGSAPQKSITWGIDFSQKQAESLKLDWKELYLAMINDLGARNIKIHTQWDLIEKQKGEFYFDDIDWQLGEAQKNGVKIIYVLGMKSGRWPECHIPKWANNLSESEQKEAILNYIEKIVERYKGYGNITYWQVENEPLFQFGKCPAWYYKSKDFLKQEVALVKSLDPARKIIISDSGEGSMWFEAAKIGDIVGSTMYREVWTHISSNLGFYFKQPFPPVFYYRKAMLIKKIFNKDVICIELQAEPWAPKPFYSVPLAEQAKTMNLQIFKKNIQYAKKTGFDAFYLWGVEWWYWMKEKQNQPQIWAEAKELF